MLAAGFPPYEVSRWLGHANLATTDAIYAHLYPSDYASHVDRFEAFVAEGALGPSSTARRPGAFLQQEPCSDVSVGRPSYVGSTSLQVARVALVGEFYILLT